jgi:hypothetical protein
VTIKADKKGRVLIPSAKPGDVFDVEFFNDGKILLTRGVQIKSKLVRARKVKGLWMGAAGLKLDPGATVAAIRADREAR